MIPSTILNRRGGGQKKGIFSRENENEKRKKVFSRFFVLFVFMFFFFFVCFVSPFCSVCFLDDLVSSTCKQQKLRVGGEKLGRHVGLRAWWGERPVHFWPPPPPVSLLFPLARSLHSPLRMFCSYELRRRRTMPYSAQ